MKTSRHGSARPLRDSPFVLDVRSLGRSPGTMREERRSVALPARIGLDMIGIPAGEVLDMDLRLEAVSEGVLVTGSVHSEATGECVRCLEDFRDEVEISVTELFAYPGSATSETTDEDEVHRIEDELIDLEPVITDAFGLALPLQPMCADDCPGLCSECGVRLAIAESGHSHEILDPRWAALADKLPSNERPEA
ncbi:DUF177 domain-containing protein [Hoyosella sp. YIM 151337]|uniref:YceD family protein n=1 Tax=Hoyosella sp. YIM 151337 TaxID=2992742 RepID=UPI0022361048|nr:DUF177 domain-containing protein [Hoyosella sp. YIM 151337]MCW4354514.1 DUF177 domain-containing protein [Hoyosella sp. YIM 151337]